MTNDTLNLGGDTLEITGTAGFNGGLITNGVCYPQATGLLSFAGTTFGAEVKAKGQIKLNGSTFNSTAYFEHIGSAAGTGTGGNTFNGPTTLKNTGTSVFKIASTYNDTFNDDVIIANAGASGAAAIQISGGANCYFNGNMTISATTVSGLTFGVLNGATYLASGKTISIGSAGLVGTLLLKNFTQYGNTAQTLSFSGVFNMVNSTFNGNLTVTATNNLLSTSSFHGQCSFTKTGSSTDIAAGGNHFYENVTFTNNATNTAAMRMASTNGDIFEKDITCNTTTGYIQLAYADTTDIYGSISINNTKANFNSGTGYTRFVGGTSQTLNGSANYSFGKLLMNKTSSGITCNKSVTIDSLLNLTSGILYTDTINYLTIKNGVVVSGGSSASYIDGPVKKIGNTAFEFPVGKNGRYMKFGISSTSNPANQFIAEYFDQGQLLGDSVTGGITGICSNEYWKLTGGVSGQTYTVSLSWDMSSRNLQSNSNKVVSAWNGASWINKGTSSINGSSLNGSIMSSTSGNENYFTIAGIGNVMNLDSISISGNFEEFGILCGGNISSVDTVLVFGSIGAYGTVGSKVLGDSVFQLNHAKYTAAISDFYSVLEQVNTLSYDSTLILNNDFHLITAGKYLITGADTLDGELFLDGDSTDKFILICNQDVYLSYKFIIRHKDVRPKNIIFILTSNSTLAEGFNYRGILFGQNFNIDNLLGGRCQLISPSGLNIENTSNNLFGVLSSYTRISMLLPYTCTSQATICNLIKNSGFENGVMPLGTNGITDYYCDCWSAESFADNTCTIGNQNTPDYLDVNGAVSGPVPCQNLPGWTGIPINHVGSSTNVRTVGSENHIHVLDGEEAEGEIDGNF
ncbi:MAG TPA: hypothetical protein PLJ43_09575, partial [Chitinophagales bacterium]|nr:hypothetical protein [Chitinophagales bacterium]